MGGVWVTKPARRVYLSENLPLTRTQFLGHLGQFLGDCEYDPLNLHPDIVTLGEYEWSPQPTDEENYLTLAEEIAQVLLGSWDPDTYKAWRFALEARTIPPRPHKEAASTCRWLQLALNIRDPFLRCYRGIYGPVGLYWLLPLLLSLHLYLNNAIREPTLTTRVVPCKGDGVLLCDGVRLPCMGGVVYEHTPRDPPATCACIPCPTRTRFNTP